MFFLPFFDLIEEPGPELRASFLGLLGGGAVSLISAGLGSLNGMYVGMGIAVISALYACYIVSPSAIRQEPREALVVWTGVNGASASHRDSDRSAFSSVV